MARGPWLRYLLVAVLALTGTVEAAGPAAAAPCTGPTCYHYWPDISIAAWTDSPTVPVFPGSTHSYTARVTNSGWRTGGVSAPTPWPGPASGVVYVGFVPNTTLDRPLGCQVDSGPPLGCFGAYDGLAFDCGSIPTNTTYQLTVFFQAPPIPGTYTFRIWATAYQHPVPWTEYDPNNNSVTITYQVGYQA